MANWFTICGAITNYIFWENSALTGPQMSNNIPPLVGYCDVQGGWPGTGNIDFDPLFVDADGDDDIVGTEDDNLRLSPGSPCIDRGDNVAIPADTYDLDGDGNTTEPIPWDLDGNPRIVGDAVDMGAYETPVPTIQVTIDIKPGSYPNAINLGSQGLIPIAIFSEVDFDATTVDPDTVELGGASVDVKVKGKSNKYMAHTEDVDEDGLVDLVVQVATANLDPESLQDGLAVLTGTTYDGQHIQGEDEITIVPPEE